MEEMLPWNIYIQRYQHCTSKNYSILMLVLFVEWFGHLLFWEKETQVKGRSHKDVHLSCW